MLSCKDVAQQASEYIDQQHGWRQRMAFRLHLFICRNCRRYINQLRNSIESFRLVKLRPQPALNKDQQQLAKQLRDQLPKR